MSPDQIFSISNPLAMIAWLALVFVPRRSARLVAGAIIPLLFALLYTFLILAHFGEGEGGFASLTDVAALFRNPWALLAGWIHYLAFDLFIGAWEVRDAQRLGIHHLAVVPCLLLTFLFGPIGLLLYTIIRAAWKKKLAVEESGDAALLR
jgi:Domain of unknown function (DUF4281)